MADDIEKLFIEIAQKHGVALSKDDPIMILHTINKRLLEDSAKAQQNLLNQYKSEMEDLALRWGDTAKGMAERVLNASLSASKNAMGKIMEESAKTSTRFVKDEIEDSLIPIVLQIKNARRLGIFNMVAASLSLMAALVALWSTFR